MKKYNFNNERRGMHSGRKRNNVLKFLHKQSVEKLKEIVYKYLFNDLTFEEEHTGLADVLIEYKILLKAFSTHKKIDSTPCQAWRILKEFCKTNNIEVTA